MEGLGIAAVVTVALIGVVIIKFWWLFLGIIIFLIWRAIHREIVIHRRAYAGLEKGDKPLLGQIMAAANWYDMERYEAHRQGKFWV